MTYGFTDWCQEHRCKCDSYHEDGLTDQKLFSRYTEIIDTPIRNDGGRSTVYSSEESNQTGRKQNHRFSEECIIEWVLYISIIFQPWVNSILLDLLLPNLLE